jgi:hypothetical protein
LVLQHLQQHRIKTALPRARHPKLQHLAPAETSPRAEAVALGAVLAIVLLTFRSHHRFQLALHNLVETGFLLRQERQYLPRLFLDAGKLHY